MLHDVQPIQINRQGLHVTIMQLNTVACTGKPAKAETPLSKKNIKRYANGFEVHDLAIGQPDGKAAQAGQRVTVEYIGSLQKNGKVFDQSKSFAFRLGERL